MLPTALGKGGIASGKRLDGTSDRKESCDNRAQPADIDWLLIFEAFFRRNLSIRYHVNETTDYSPCITLCQCPVWWPRRNNRPETLGGAYQEMIVRRRKGE